MPFVKIIKNKAYFKRYQVGLDELYEGNTDPEGEVVKTEVGKKEYYVEELDDDKRPFKCILDVGIQTTTTGNRVFGALKGATDGGLDIPHNYKRFPGYDKESKEFDAEAMKDRIFGAHVSEYMEKLMDEDNAKYQQLFADYIKEGVEPDGMEDLYTSVHEAIREDPSPAEKEERCRAKKAEMEEDDEDGEDEDEAEEAEEAPEAATGRFRRSSRSAAAPPLRALGSMTLALGFRGVARELEHLGREVLEDGGRVDGGRGADALGGGHAI
ncbi:5S rRNA binding protein [Aureococcus anophagefferens]|nr:5S rRNA binding protein [Aureococcus anophagefferens]